MLRRVFMAFVGCLALTCAALPAASAPSTQSPEEFVLKVSNEILDAIKKDPKLQQGEKRLWKPWLMKNDACCRFPENDSYGRWSEMAPSNA